MLKFAAACSLLLGLGFGLPAAYGARHLATTGEIWTFLGFPTYGGGPFERWGVSTTVPLMLAFLTVCAAEVVVAVLLWAEHTVGLWMALALLPFEILFWIGFALPFGPPLGIVRTALVALVLTGPR